MANYNLSHSYQLLCAITGEKQVNTRNKLVAAFMQKPEFIEYELEPEDVFMIGRLWKLQTVVQKPVLKGNAMLKIYSSKNWNPAQVLQHLVCLIDKGVIGITSRMEVDYHSLPMTLLPAEFRLRSNLVHKISGLNPPEYIGSILKQKLYSQEELMRVIRKAFRLIREHYWEAENNLLHSVGQLHSDYYIPCIDTVIDMIRSARYIPLANKLNRKKLNSQEMAIIIYMLYKHMHDEVNHAGEHLIRLISPRSEEISNYSYLLESCATLLKNDVLTECNGFVETSAPHFRLSDSIMTFLEKPKSEKHTQSATNKQENDKDHNKNTALYNVPVIHRLSDLILPETDMKLLKAAIRRFKSGTVSELDKWGVGRHRGIKDEQKGMIVLFYGDSGTGKTFAAGAIAAELNKKIMGIDATHLRDKWYGNTEKIIRQLFEDMRHMVIVSNDPPIFLLNEADQIIHRRSDNPEDSGNTENAVQNIILEEMETFPGFLIMTTNLAKNFDKAFFRRINIKIEFTQPDYNCRLRLWKKHLLPTIPGANKIDIKFLAENFEFTGGQISLVVYNACNEVVTRRGKAKVLTMDELIKYAQLEQPWGVSKKAVGFGALL
jgi:hypothetical protein